MAPLGQLVWDWLVERGRGRLQKGWVVCLWKEGWARTLLHHKVPGGTAVQSTPAQSMVVPWVGVDYTASWSTPNDPNPQQQQPDLPPQVILSISPLPSGSQTQGPREKDIQPHRQKWAWWVKSQATLQDKAWSWRETGGTTGKGKCPILL
jgi:hypothetical protein